MMKADYKKATQVINYIINIFPEKKINDLTVVKLVWIADRYHLRKYGRPVLNDQYVAMKNGPVASLVKDLIDKSSFLTNEEKKYAEEYLGNLNTRIVKSIKDVDLSVFSKTDLEAMDFAISNFSTYLSPALVKMSHEYPEWKKHQEQLDGGLRQVCMDYSDFFENPESIKNDLFATDATLLEINKEAFEESKENDLRL